MTADEIRKASGFCLEHMLADDWWNHPEPGSALARATPEERARRGASVLEGRELVRAGRAMLARGMTDAEVDRVMGPRR